ncbi:MATE family efflux transporter [Ideonella aquatica]|uniref:MATE family efflux transporter n=1 Tax=Ideonella aquatica TaxID=2824119 RepID=UPI001FFD77A0|nr:MATE family efflux transporter [Ideonella aquatica]
MSGPGAAPRPRLLPLIWPLYLELWLGVAVGIVGTALAARGGDAAGGAFAIAHQLAAMLFVLFRIIGAGASVVLTQRLGAGQRDQADAVALATLGASSWLGGGTGLACVLFAGPLLALLNTPPEVLPLAEPFLRWLGLSLLLDAWNASMAAVMRSHLRARDTLMVIVAMHATHLALSLPLMLGWGPLPAWGLSGFALALLVSRALGVGLHLLLWGRRLQLRPRAADWWRLPRAELAAVLHIGLPGAAENIAWRLCFMASLAVVGLLGAAALATHAYVMQVMMGVLLFGAATGIAVEIVVGHLVGAGRLREADRLLRRAMGVGLAVSTGLALAVALAGPWLMRLFTRDEAIIAMGVRLLWLTVAVESGRTFNLVVINALRATGDARYPVMAGTASMLVVLAGGSWALGIGLGWGLPGLWVAYAADEWLRGLLMWRRWVRLRWVPYARATHRRLRPA